MNDSEDEKLASLGEELLAILERDELPDIPALCAQFEVPEDAGRRCFHTVARLYDLIDEELAQGQLLRSPPPSLPADFEVRGEIGSGGMGIVYRVYQHSLGRDVALKALLPSETLTTDSIRRFRREARNLARLQHEHIVAVHSVGESDGRVWFTMDLIEGRSLADELADGPLEPARALRILLQVCDAMTYAHEQGIVHRDLKPANVLLDKDGNAFVADFGMARNETSETFTATGRMLGTPAYMSPEQARGDWDQVGESTDIHAIGVLLIECLTGVSPFARPSLVATIRAVTDEQAPHLRSLDKRIPKDLAAICKRATAKEPAGRYPAMRALQLDITSFLNGRRLRPSRPTPLARFGTWARRNRPALLGSSVVAAIAVFLTLLLLIPLAKHQSQQVAELGQSSLDSEDYATAVQSYRLAVSQASGERQARLELKLGNALVRHAALTMASGEKAEDLLDEADGIVKRYEHYSWSKGELSYQSVRRQEREWIEFTLSAIRGTGHAHMGALTLATNKEQERKAYEDYIDSFGLHDEGNPTHLLALQMLVSLEGFGSRFAMDFLRGKDGPFLLASLVLNSDVLPVEFRNSDLDSLLRRKGKLPGFLRTNELEARLAEICEESENSTAVRLLAASLLSDSASLPPLPIFPTDELSDQVKPGEKMMMAEALVAHWQDVHSLRRIERLQQNLAFAMDSRWDDTRIPWNWVHSHSRFSGYNSDAIRTWLVENEHIDPRAWLGEFLGEGDKPNLIDTTLLHARLAKTADQREAYRIHLLLELLTATGEVGRPSLPWLVHFDKASPSRFNFDAYWAERLGLQKASPQVAPQLCRLAFLSRVDADPLPAILWSTSVVLRHGVTQTISGKAMLKARMFTASAGLYSRPNLREAGSQANVAFELDVTPGGTKADPTVAITRFESKPDMPANRLNGSWNIGMGNVHYGAWPETGAQMWSSSLLTSVAPWTDDADSRAVWNLEDWRQAGIRSLHEGSAGTSKARVPYLANVLPMPEASDALATAALALSDADSDSAEVLWLARLLAGDAAALENKPGRESDRSRPEILPKEMRQEMLTALLLTTGNAAIQATAASELANLEGSFLDEKRGPWAGVSARIVHEIDEGDLAIPASAERVLRKRAGNGRLGWLFNQTGFLLGACGMLGFLLGGLIYLKSGHGTNHRRLLIAVLVLATGIQFSNVHLVFDGVNYLPPFIGPSLVLYAGYLRWRLSPETENGLVLAFVLVPYLVALDSFGEWLSDSVETTHWGLILLALHFALVQCEASRRKTLRNALSVSPEQWRADCLTA